MKTSTRRPNVLLLVRQQIQTLHERSIMTRLLLSNGGSCLQVVIILAFLLAWTVARKELGQEQHARVGPATWHDKFGNCYTRSGMNLSRGYMESLQRSRETGNCNSMTTGLVDLDQRREERLAVRAAIVILAQKKRLTDLREVLSSIRRYFHKTYAYPVLIFHEDFEPELMQELRDLMTVSLHFEKVDFTCKCSATCHKSTQWAIQSKGSRGYRQMCRFWTYPVFLTKLCGRYDYFWRLDSDSKLVAAVPLDPFAQMRSSGYIYGTRKVASPGGDCKRPSSRIHYLTNVDQLSACLATTHPSALSNRKKYIWDLVDKETSLYKACSGFETNFEIVDIKFFRSRAIEDFFNVLDSSDGFFQYRWGDAHTRAAQIALFGDRDAVRCFDEVPYYHKYLFPNDSCMATGMFSPLDSTLPSLTKGAATISENALQSWISGFVAADPAYQHWCTSRLAGKIVDVDGRPGGSQHWQDMFTFHNLFLRKAMDGERGFYIDSGANHWVFQSNTFFYDKCLGWSGLCLEPDPRYARGHEMNRTCKFYPECITSSETNMDLMPGGIVTLNGSDPKNLGRLYDEKKAKKRGQSPTRVRCRPLRSFLDDIGISHVDMWSLDVEGHEMTILRSGLPFENIDVILMENFWLNTRSSDYFLSRAGYVKFAQMPVDGLFVKRRQGLWYPADEAQMWQAKLRERKGARARQMIDPDE